GNMAFGLKLRKTPRAEIERRVQAAAELLGLEPLLDRKPRALSGGQRQRVALGRAMVRQPAAFLFDEPLSNLDARLRVEMRAEIKRLHRQMKVTTVYVTHDQEEAMTLGDRVAVMHDGAVRQCDAPLKIYDHPADRFVASFVGMPPMNFLPGTIEQTGDATWFIGAGTRLRVADQGPTGERRAAGPAVAGIRPEAIEISDPSADDDNCLPAVVQLIEPLGASIDVILVAAGEKLICRTATRTLNEGQSVSLRMPPERIRLFPPES
ncbi:MAG: TOBE domain-containing protein, partial [Planctomycetota bacterium]